MRDLIEQPPEDDLPLWQEAPPKRRGFGYWRLAAGISYWLFVASMAVLVALVALTRWAYSVSPTLAVVGWSVVVAFALGILAGRRLLLWTIVHRYGAAPEGMMVWNPWVRVVAKLAAVVAGVLAVTGIILQFTGI